MVGVACNRFESTTVVCAEYPHHQYDSSVYSKLPKEEKKVWGGGVVTGLSECLIPSWKNPMIRVAMIAPAYSRGQTAGKQV